MDMSSVLVFLLQWMGDIVKSTLPHGGEGKHQGSIDHLAAKRLDVRKEGQDHAR